MAAKKKSRKKKEAIEKIFKVKVEKVNTLIKDRRARRFGRFISKPKRIKKAYVKLKHGDKIEIVEGV